MRKLNIILNYFNIYSIHYAYTIVPYYCIGRWINRYAGRWQGAHQITSAPSLRPKDVPDVACILTASKVANVEVSRRPLEIP